MNLIKFHIEPLQFGLIILKFTLKKKCFNLSNMAMKTRRDHSDPDKKSRGIKEQRA